MGSMIQAPQLVYLKLKSPRQKDRVDVIELLKAGLGIDACRAYLATHAPELVPMFEIRWPRPRPRSNEAAHVVLARAALRSSRFRRR
jgi:hypothetical protein